MLVVIAGGIAACAEKAAPERALLTIDTPVGPARFTVEIADTPAERERGLMYRQTLAEDAGMLFLFEDEVRRSFWMKNTYLPLDMIFIQASGRIAAIVENTTPLSLEPVSPKVNAKAVLELNGGTAARRGIAVGARVHYPALEQQ